MTATLDRSLLDFSAGTANMQHSGSFGKPTEQTWVGSGDGHYPYQLAAIPDSEV